MQKWINNPFLRIYSTTWHQNVLPKNRKILTPLYCFYRFDQPAKVLTVSIINKNCRNFFINFNYLNNKKKTMNEKNLSDNSFSSRKLRGLYFQCTEKAVLCPGLKFIFLLNELFLTVGRRFQWNMLFFACSLFSHNSEHAAAVPNNIIKATMQPF